jgi:hypothetical protein
VFLCLETIAMAVAFGVALQRLRQGGPTPPQWTYTGLVAFIGECISICVSSYVRVGNVTDDMFCVQFLTSRFCSRC